MNFSFFWATMFPSLPHALRVSRHDPKWPFCLFGTSIADEKGNKIVNYAQNGKVTWLGRFCCAALALDPGWMDGGGGLATMCPVH